MERFHWLLSILFALGAFGKDAVNTGCDVTNLKPYEIRGGRTEVQDNNTVLQYICPEGQYPYPTEFRTCEFGIRWNIMENANGGVVRQAKCRDVRCHRVLEFENGDYEPRQQYYNISQNITFNCYSGYSMKGSQVRTCLPNGKWSGQTTICYSGVGHCDNPGIPIGGQKEGKYYRIEFRVRYTCGTGLILVGSSERTCQESKTWSGSEPECRQPFSFDSPKEVASKFVSSLTEAAEGAEANRNISSTTKRRIVIKKGGTMNIYFVLDSSRSITKKNFKDTQNVTIKLIEKISSYDVSPNYGAITFATNSREVFSTMHPKSAEAAWVIEQLENIKYGDHRQKPGTNIRRGLQAVYEMMISQEADEKARGLNPPPISNSTRHVIILLSDGAYNMGGDPISVIGDIKDFLRIGKSRTKPRDEFLDVYVFGVGREANVNNMNNLASKKPGERHVFKLKNVPDLQEAFDEMINESETLSMCGLAKEYKSADDQMKNPWHAKIAIRRTGGAGFEHCKGTLVSEYYILTAAHCFTVDDTAEQITVYVDKQQFSVAAIRMHPKFLLGKLKDRGISEFYDYDVALVKLAKKLDFRFNARPICLPCTYGTSRALRMPVAETTCKDHENELLPMGNIQSFFVTDCEKKEQASHGLLRRTVQIKNSDKKLACEQDARHAELYQNVTDIKEIVTENFLCTGGQEPVLDPNTCKGDSGGPLIIQKRLRYVQVGVISWGVVDVCKGSAAICNRPYAFQKGSPAYARDYHTNLFKVIPWLKTELADEVEFI